MAAVGSENGMRELGVVLILVIKVSVLPESTLYVTTRWALETEC